MAAWHRDRSLRCTGWVAHWLTRIAAMAPEFPAILDVHGGPHWITPDAFDAIAQTWLDHGFAWLTVNYRLAAFEAGFDAARLTEVTSALNDGGIHLSLPKFSARTHVTLNDTLKALGMPTAFDPSTADFSGMTGSNGLYISTVEHEAFIEVDEEGTRATAATGAVIAESHGPTVTVDRPFLYVVRDRGAGTVLFVGRVVDPRAEG